MRIPIAVCHEINGSDNALPAEHPYLLAGITRELGFESIDYNQLYTYRRGGDLPARSIIR